MRELCVIDGTLMPLAEARISPLDRGWLYGDAVYETLRVERGGALWVDAHLERLGRSLAAVEMEPPLPGLRLQIERLVRESGLDHGGLYLQISRGAGRRQHLPPTDLRPTVFLMPLAAAPWPWGERPMRLVSMIDPRWARCDVKTTSLMGTVLGKLRAREHAADEVLFLDPATGEAREGGSTSFFAVCRQDGIPVLRTHPLDGRVLSGITRARVLRVARAAGIAVEESAVPLSQREHWSEAFLCGTLTGVQPVASLDGSPVPAGPVAPLLAAALAAENDRHGNPGPRP